MDNNNTTTIQGWRLLPKGVDSGPKVGQVAKEMVVLSGRRKTRGGVTMPRQGLHAV